MNAKRQFGLIAFLFAVFSNAEFALAQQSVGLVFSQTFIGTCAQDFPDTDRLKAAAKTFGWKELNDPNIRAMFGPADPSAIWQSWFLTQDNSKFVVGISEGIVDGKQVRTCNLVQDRTDVKSVISELTKLLNATKIDESMEAGQRSMVWQFKKNDQSYLLLTLDGTPMNMELINATITSDIRAK